VTKRSERKQAKRREDELLATRRLADEALAAAGAVGSIAELANPDDTGEMRTVLSTLLQTEQTLTGIASRFIRER
jgi:hypothetical protein